MKYFFLAYAVAIIFVIGMFGFRGDKFSQPPLEVFPDMDSQDKIMPQSPSGMFKDGMGARMPIPGTVPKGGDNGVLPVDFGEGRTGYYYDGKLDGAFGNGMPEELKLTDEKAATAFLARGKEMYGVHCAVCHGASGNGKGVVTKYKGMAVVSDIHLFPQDKSPDGRIFQVISEGHGNMGGYKHNLPVRDRWAIVAYVRALQAAKSGN